ncbi:GlsB/YeaQ/YmgE family stress response membrane protein [Paenibacillus herberti]|uniref:GlsB/YeaQ/YmgE family stress response membrane protein n=1 Tax=Paenibacillus herberti TaxID=1619309 RepID=A0A229P466_9BACL|nr:GlsB/YeaQ/YmgE family stress response membrane protein [Paenibacillus herberti]OXM17052.1 GlsB/YeaQ/YmgE family stress response membrane protein [Paenibacillus herberti]
MSLLWALIVGGIIGWLAGMLVGRDVPGGIIGNIVAGFIGAWLGSMLLGQWGPVVGGFYFVPALIGAIVLVLIVSLILGSMRRAR